MEFILLGGTGTIAYKLVSSAAISAKLSVGEFVKKQLDKHGLNVVSHITKIRQKMAYIRDIAPHLVFVQKLLHQKLTNDARPDFHPEWRAISSSLDALVENIHNAGFSLVGFYYSFQLYNDLFLQLNEKTWFSKRIRDKPELEKTLRDAEKASLGNIRKKNNYMARHYTPDEWLEKESLGQLFLSCYSIRPLPLIITLPTIPMILNVVLDPKARKRWSTMMVDSQQTTPYTDYVQCNLVGMGHILPNTTWKGKNGKHRVILRNMVRVIDGKKGWFTTTPRTLYRDKEEKSLSGKKIFDRVRPLFQENSYLHLETVDVHFEYTIKEIQGNGCKQWHLTRIKVIQPLGNDPSVRYTMTSGRKRGKGVLYPWGELKIEHLDAQIYRTHDRVSYQRWETSQATHIPGVGTVRKKIDVTMHNQQSSVTVRIPTDSLDHETHVHVSTPDGNTNIDTMTALQDRRFTILVPKFLFHARYTPSVLGKQEYKYQDPRRKADLKQVTFLDNDLTYDIPQGMTLQKWLRNQVERVTMVAKQYGTLYLQIPVWKQQIDILFRSPITRQLRYEDYWKKKTNEEVVEAIPVNVPNPPENETKECRMYKEALNDTMDSETAAPREIIEDFLALAGW